MKLILCLSTSLILLLCFISYACTADQAFHCGEAITHENLTIYPIYAKQQVDTSQFLTLQEAMKQELVTVHETGTVNELSISVTGDVKVYIQAGDVVKGGKQDRAIGYDMIVCKADGKVPLNAFCVEQGRWQKRGKEAVGQFKESKNYVIGNDLKSAIRDSFVEQQPQQQGQQQEQQNDNQEFNEQSEAQSIPQTQVLNGINQELSNNFLNIGSSNSVSSTNFAGRSNGQSAVWNQVSSNQSKVLLNSSLKAEDLESGSSLQLTMEHTKTQEAIKGYEKAFSDLFQNDKEMVGFAFAINGQLNSAELYCSNDLFSRMSKKLLQSAATEALTLKGKDKVNTLNHSADEVETWVNKPTDYKKQYDKNDNIMYNKGKERCYDSHYNFDEKNDGKGNMLHRTMLK